MDQEHPSLAIRLRRIGVSESYASQIVNGRRRPSLALALRIHRELGERVGLLSSCTDEQIAALARVEAASKGRAA